MLREAQTDCDCRGDRGQSSDLGSWDCTADVWRPSNIVPAFRFACLPKDSDFASHPSAPRVVSGETGFLGRPAQ